MGLVREMVRFGVMKAATNAFYSSGTSRGTVDGKVTLNLLRQIALTILANHGKMKNRILASGPNYDTSAIEAGFLVFSHNDLEPDIRDLEGFVPTAKYAQRKVINEYELGSVERFRFVCSPELSSYADSGAAIAGTDLYSTTGTLADVYPMIVCGSDATYDVALKGSKSFDLSIIPHTQKDKADILGQRGYVGAKFWSAALVTNNGWMAVAEVARTAL